MQKNGHRLGLFHSLKKGVSIFARNWQLFLIYELFFKTLYLVLLAPLGALAFAWATWLAGGKLLSNNLIFSFLLSPLGLGVVIISAGVLLAVTMVEQAGLMALWVGRRQGQPFPPAAAIWLALKKIPTLSAISTLQFALYLLSALPCIGIGALLYYFFLASYDLNYLVVSKPPVFWWCLSFALVLVAATTVIAAFFYVRLIFAIPFHLFAGLSLSSAVKASHKMVRPDFYRLSGILILWLVLSLFFLALAGFSIDQLRSLCLPLAGRNMTAVVSLMAAFLALDVMAFFLINAFGLGVNSILLVECYFHYQPWPESTQLKVLRSDSPLTPGPHLRRWLALAALTFIFISVSSAFAILEQAKQEDRVQITAHRGSSSKAPENSLAAIEQAILDGAHYAEIDVQETGDGSLVLLHDTDLLRITGLRKRIWEVSYGEIAELDAGSWFSAEFAGQRIPTLAQAIHTARGRIKLNIELKFHGREKALIENVVHTIEQEEFIEECLVTSLDFKGIKKVKQLNPRIRAGYVVFKTFSDLSKLDLEVLSLQTRLATQSVIFAAKKAGREIHVWTVNDPLQMSLFIDRGVDNIITDHPDVLAQLLRERQELSDVERLLLRSSERPWQRPGAGTKDESTPQ